MSEQGFNDEMHHLVILMASLLAFALGIHWAVYVIDFTFPSGDDYVASFLAIINPYIFYIRLGYIACLFAFFYIKKSRYKDPGKAVGLKRVIHAMIILTFLFGYSNFTAYNTFIVPVLILVSIYSVFTIFTTFTIRLKSQNIFGITKEKPFKKLYYDYETDQGTLRVHSGEQHTYVTGGTGAGKGSSIMHPTIYQHIDKFDYPALIYDVKPELPLTKTAHTAFYHGKQKGKKFNTKLVVFNISNPEMSFRVNPFSERYLSKDDAQKVTELVTNFLTNYKAEWRGENAKKDHWYEACLTVWTSLVMRFLVDDEIRDKLSLPMICELILTHRIGSVINFILDKPESARMFSQIRLSAMGSMKQFTGEFSSAMTGLSSIIMDRNLYWLFSSDEIDFDINNPENPTVLCVGGSEAAPTTYTPFIATIISLVMSYFREPNKLPALFQLDEIYTIFLEHLPRDSNKFRSNGISMQIGNQLMTMLYDSYGKNKANNLFGACGNQFYGMGNDQISSEILEKMLGDIKVENVSYSSSDSSQSVSTSLKQEKAMSVRKINEQPTGHFTGKIANGKPPYFSAQFKPYKYDGKEENLPKFVTEGYGSKEVLQKEIDINYDAIQSYAKSILESYPNVLPKEDDMS